MNQLQRIIRARTHLLLDKPYYGFQLLQLDLIEDESIPKACTNGKYIKFNPRFIETLNNRQIQTLLVHENRHINYLHHLRRKNRPLDIWNIACDYAINYPIIYEDNLPTIDGILIDVKYKNKSAEQIYKEIYEERNNKGDNEESSKKSESDGNNQDRQDTNNDTRESTDTSSTTKNGDSTKKYKGFGDVEDAPPDITTSEEIEKIKEVMVQATQFAKKAGKLPAYIEREVTDILKPKIPWERLLINWFDERSNQDYTWLVRDNRIQDYYFPSLNNEELGTIGIAIDISSSINQNLYNKFISEIDGLRKKYNFDCIIVACNTQITESKTYTKYQKIDFKPKGGGGTAFKPTFDFFKNKNIKGLIYFTDMYSPDLNSLKRPQFDTLWLDYGYGIKPKFGKHIKIK